MAVAACRMQEGLTPHMTDIKAAVLLECLSLSGQQPGRQVGGIEGEGGGKG